MAGTDLISALPVEIKISILCCLEVKYAVRTSALARSWRHLWTLLPCLHLGYFLDRLGDTTTDANFSRSPVVATSWVERIHHLVSSLRGPLSKFVLSHYFSSDQSALLQSLLDLLLQKGGVQRLILTSYSDRVVVHLPSFHSLKILQLFRCHVVLPAGFRGFKSLITLALDFVQISNDHLHFLIHSSNNLITLWNSEIVSSEDPLSINISLPLLRHLKFGINESVEKATVISAPCLEQAHIFIWKHEDYISQKLARVALQMVTSVATVSYLHLDRGVLQESFIFGSF